MNKAQEILNSSEEYNKTMKVNWWALSGMVIWIGTGIACIGVKSCEPLEYAMTASVFLGIA